MTRTYLKHGIWGLMWTAGLILAGSDGDYMPWMNLLGVGVFATAFRLMCGRRLSVGARVFGRLKSSVIKFNAGRMLSEDGVYERWTCCEGETAGKGFETGFRKAYL